MMIHPDTALKIILENANFDILKTEVISISKALGRCLGTDVKASFDMPPFHKATMDGYAYRTDDKSDKYKVVEIIPAGKKPEKTIKHGECAKIMTGAALPEGADMVIRREFTTEKDGFMYINQYEKYNNIAYRGENFKANDIVLKKGKISVKEIGILAMLGISEVEVKKPPLVGVITTGTELKLPGEKLGFGEIYNSNGFQITAHLESIKVPFKYYGLAFDDRKEIDHQFKLAMSECDVVIFSGGVSRGDFDFVRDVFAENDIDILFHRVAVKPGRPTTFAVKKDTNKYFFGLPGNPVSTFVTFEIFVKPFLYKLMGCESDDLWFNAELTEFVERKAVERVEYLPVNVKNGQIYPIRYLGSGHLNALATANALMKMDIGEGTADKGSIMNVRSI